MKKETIIDIDHIDMDDKLRSKKWDEDKYIKIWGETVVAKETHRRDFTIIQPINCIPAIRFDNVTNENGEMLLSVLIPVSLLEYYTEHVIDAHDASSERDEVHCRIGPIYYRFIKISDDLWAGINADGTWELNRTSKQVKEYVSRDLSEEIEAGFYSLV